MILGAIQSRMSSTRFPGKALKPILGIPMLLFMADRARQAKWIDLLVIATSIDKTDNPIRELCQQNRIPCFSGSLEDVLGRFYWLAEMFGPEHIVRLTGDCPMIDSEIVDATIKHHVIGGYDYTRNYGFADGLDVEIMTHNALRIAHRDATEPYDREHVTPYFYHNPDKFKLGRYENITDHSKMKISVDTPEDYEKVTRLVEIAISMASTVKVYR